MIKQNSLLELTHNITDGKHGDCLNEEGSGYYFISVKDIKPYGINYYNARQITRNDFIETHKRTKLEVGDILLANSGHTIGKMLFVKESKFVSKTTFQKSVAIIKPNTLKVDGNFLYYNLLANVKGLKRAAVGSAQPNLLLRDLREFNVDIYEDLVYQSRIAKVLANLDAKIELNNKINQELEAMSKLIYDYWFVQFDFPDENGKPYKSSGGKIVFNEELKREIPEGWGVGKFEEYVNVVRGASPRPIDDYISKEGLPWIKISDATKLNSRFITKTKQFIKNEGRTKTRIMQKGDLILSNSATPGLPKIVQIQSGIHDGWLFLESKVDCIKNEFLFQYFTNERPRILYLGSGSIFKNLKTEYIKNIKFLKPPDKILDMFNSIAKPISDKLFVVASENQELSSLRDWLLPMLMNGQVKVKS